MADGGAIVQRRKRPTAAFRERDVKAAIRAVRAAGEKVAGVDFRPDGRFRVIVASDGSAEEARNPWDEED